MSIAGGIAGLRCSNPTCFFIHNDAGGQYATAKYYAEKYKHIQGDEPFVHYVVDTEDLIQIEDEQYKAWHCGNTWGNTYGLSLEICQSKWLPDKLFLEVEKKALRLVYERLRAYGLPINDKTIMLHQEVYATACPHRSIELHGGTVKSCKQYFIDTMLNFKNEMIPTNVIEERIRKMRDGYIKDGDAYIYFNVDTGIYIPLKSTNQKKFIDGLGKDLKVFVNSENEQYLKTLKGILKNQKRK